MNDESCDAKVVVVDATKLFKLASSVFRGRGKIYDCFISLKKRTDVIVVTTSITVRRAWQSFCRKNEEFDSIEEEYYGKIEFLVDEVLEESMYKNFLENADEILNDQDEEKEDTHVLAAAVYLKEIGQEIGQKTYIWTDDTDFLKRKDEIERMWGIEVIKLTDEI
ncbi:hypothetical protein [Desulfurobacterium sp. TC5-1]|uniref:hypothetical protein n=1 Tax=Desulfurobacterium sp. TC5-1 TaxID=1158318 RepID=UPI0003B47787|nr:hypothetical protein [Desulfurobacterium sp. TC5-1]